MKPCLFIKILDVLLQLSLVCGCYRLAISFCSGGGDCGRYEWWRYRRLVSNGPIQCAQYIQGRSGKLLRCQDNGTLGRTRAGTSDCLLSFLSSSVVLRFCRVALESGCIPCTLYVRAESLRPINCCGLVVGFLLRGRTVGTSLQMNRFVARKLKSIYLIMVI